MAAVRPDEIVTLSQFSQKNIEAVYKRKSEILYPPFDVSYFRSLMKKDRKPSVTLPSSYFMFVGRLEPYKRVDLLVETWAKGHKENLVIVGTGTEKKKLINIIKVIKNITFITIPLTDAELMYVYKHARALIMPQAEDFGYTALEALYAGTPVVSFKYSGAADMVTDGENGILFNEQNVYDINKALDRVGKLQYNRKEEFFEKFSKEKFLTELEGRLV
ncbi:MAG: glycosyltransferase [Patescibacteria group bacterium]